MSTIIGNPIMLGGGSGISAPIIGKDFNWTGGDGTYQVLDDGDGNWRIKFLSSGIFTPLKDMVIDAFVVGGGGGGMHNTSYSSYYGGGGGYTITALSIVLVTNTEYQVVVGAGGAGITNAGGTAPSGGSSSAFGVSVDGGFGAGTRKGGNGGSGGGGNNGVGGTDGSNGTGSNPGTGQGTTTREFGESTGTLYASGGDGLKGTMNAASNTGDGGDSTMNGGSGIVIIRKHKEAAA